VQQQRQGQIQGSFAALRMTFSKMGSDHRRERHSYDDWVVEFLG